MNTTRNSDFGGLCAAAQHLFERFNAELVFAEGLCALHPDRAAEWHRAIRDASAAFEAVLRSQGLGAISTAVHEGESRLAPLQATAKTYTVHCVGHAHIDMNWMWSWPETVAVTVDTFTTVLRLMEEFPDFCFSQSQASTYAIIEQHRPDLLQQIQARVREGRWEVTASHWVECDKNLVGAEALCRHLLYTRRYIQRLFGLAPEDVPIDWAPDTFGHAATVPTYLVQGGVHYVYMHRPGSVQAPKPWLFWWEGPDGARILVKNDSRARYGYNGVVTGEILARETPAFCGETGLRDHMFVYGVGDHGGGPTRRDLLQIRELDSWPVFPNVRCATARAYFQRVMPLATRVPVLKGELNYEFAGCYTSQSLIKRVNRLGENRLHDAERAAVVAWLGAGFRYPSGVFEGAWRDVLFNHFHDILPGSGVADTRMYAHGLFQKTMATSAQIEMRALRLLAGKVNTDLPGESAGGALPPSRVTSAAGSGVGFGAAEGGLSLSDQSGGEGPWPFVLFNPLATPRREVVSVTVWENLPPGGTVGRPLKARSFGVLAPDGKVLPAQIAESGNYWGHSFVTLLFPAEIPALGYALYIVQEGEAPAACGGGVRQIGPTHPCPYSMVERAPEGLENDAVRLEIDPRTGGILRLTDKRSGIDLVAPQPPAPALEYSVERPHNMTAWLIQHEGRRPEEPVLRNLRRTHAGPHKASIEADLRVHESNFTLTYELMADDPRLHIRLRGTWVERGGPEYGVPVLNFILPLALTDVRARYEIPFGSIDRTECRREEVPALQWAQVWGKAGTKKAGCVLANDSKHGYSLDGNTLRLTLIRGSYDPDPLPEIGQHQVALTLTPFEGELPVEEAIRQGQELNHPVRVVGTDRHAGPWRSVGQFIEVRPSSVHVCGVKKAEEGEGLIMRLFNPTEIEQSVSIRLDRELLGRPKGVSELDLMERPRPACASRLEDGAVVVSMRPHSLLTLRLDISAQ